MADFTPHPWERPLGHLDRRDRDIGAQPYDRQEQRVAEYLFEQGVGGGDDPVGFLITANAWAASMVQAMQKIALLPASDDLGERARKIAMEALSWDEVAS